MLVIAGGAERRKSTGNSDSSDEGAVNVIEGRIK
jgi:hypothetical protein